MKIQQNYQLQIDQLTAEREKQAMSGNSKLNDLDAKINELKQMLFPDFMVTPYHDLTADIILQQHKYYVSKEEHEEEV